MPREVWTIEIGALINALGTGLVLPFLIIYFHEYRDFSLPLAGLLVATISGVGVVTGPLAGPWIDRFSASAVLVGSLVAMALGYAAIGLAVSIPAAILATLVAGAGNGSFYPSQASLLASMAAKTDRHLVFATQRVLMNIGYGVGALAGGILVSGTSDYRLLFFLDAATFACYAVVARLVSVGSRSTEDAGPVKDVSPPADYRSALADRNLLFLLGLNTVFILSAYAGFISLAPPYARSAGISTTAIGALFVVNSVIVIAAQLSIARGLGGRSRSLSIAAVGVLWAAGLLLILVAGGTHLAVGPAFALFVVAFVLFSLGECVYSAVLSPLIADLAPERLLGRYMALTSFTWQFSLALGPLIGAILLNVGPTLWWVLAAALCLAAALVARRLEGSLPPAARRTPDPGAGARPGPAEGL